MFSIDPADEVVNAVIDVLGMHPELTVGDLHEKLRKRKVRVTLQHLYRVVSRLIDSQVVLKRKKTLSLNLLWLSSLELFAQSAREKLHRSRDFDDIKFLPDGGRMNFPAQSLQQVQSLWHHLLIQLHKITPEAQRGALHKYYSHAYWLVHPEADIDFYQRIAEKVRCYWLIGNESFLDLDAQRRFRRIFTIATATRPPFPKEGYLLNVFGDFVLECVLQKPLVDHLALLFSSVRSEDEWNPELVDSLFRMRAACSVTLWRSKKRAEELRRKIEHLLPRMLRPA